MGLASSCSAFLWPSSRHFVSASCFLCCLLSHVATSCLLSESCCRGVVCCLDARSALLFVLLVLAVFLFGCLFSMCVVCFALSCHLLCFFLGVASPSSATNHFLLCAPLLLRFCFFCLLCFFSSLFLTKGGRTEARIPRCKAVGLVVFGWGFGFVSFLFVCFFFFFVNCEVGVSFILFVFFTMHGRSSKRTTPT